MTDKKPEINPHNIRTKKQYNATLRGLDKGCIWCNREEQESPLICNNQFQYWEVRKNVFPKEHRDMYLIILKRHSPQSGITPEEGAEFFVVRSWLIKEFKLPGGCFIHRFGDPARNGSGLPDPDIHYSENIVVPDGLASVTETLVKDMSLEKVRAREERAKSFTDPD